MNAMHITNGVRAILLLGLGSGLCSCGSNQSDLTLTGACTSTRQCSAGTFCRTTSGECVPEIEGVIAGSFECAVLTDYTDIPSERFEFQGSLGGTRYVLAAGGSCVVGQSFDAQDNLVDSLEISGNVLAGGFTDFSVNVPWVQEATNFDITEPRFPFMLNSGTLLRETSIGFTYLGFSSSGWVALEAPASVGSPLRGYLEVAVTPIANLAFPGDSCERLSDCGLQATNKECFGGQCLMFCQSDLDCAPYGTGCDLSNATCLPPG